MTESAKTALNGSESQQQPHHNITVRNANSTSSMCASLEDYYAVTRNEWNNEARKRIIRNMQFIRGLMLTTFSIILMASISNLISEIIACTKYPVRTSVRSSSLVITHQLMMITVCLISIHVYMSGKYQLSLPINLLIVIHAILVFFEFMSVFSVIFPNSGYHKNQTRLASENELSMDYDFEDSYTLENKTTTTTTTVKPVSRSKRRMFNITEDVPYYVPGYVITISVVFSFLHIILTCLIDYSRRLNSRLSDWYLHHDAKDRPQLTPLEDELDQLISPTARPSELMKLAASPIRSGSLSPNQSPSGSPSAPKSLVTNPKPKSEPIVISKNETK